jgi:uncharacterized Rossmann fold enzyme/SAM-dependent methyltransferase
MRIEITCNTDDDRLFANVAANSMLDLPWVTKADAHDGHAVIVGGGHSIKETIESIRHRQSLGQTVFALNGAAEWLYQQGVRPDYQVIVDAREHNKRFIRYPWAKRLLLSSQCHPSLFVAGGDHVTLWHPVIDGIDDHILADRPYAKVGGGTTVGLSAMALAYTLGYRKLHLYGYDSCHQDGKGHAYPQPENATDPECKVTVFGKTFRASLAMAKQAELFPELCDTLIDLGCVITCDGEGLIPWIMRHNRPMSEAEKYRLMWSLPEYRHVAPGELVADEFMRIVRPLGRVIDFGCGTGRGALRISRECEVVCVDFVENSRDDEAKSLPFVLWDFSEPGTAPIQGDFGYCTDVMEHIPPEKVDTTIANLLSATPKVFFQISTVPDNLGALIGQPLHLSVHQHDWWDEKFRSLGYAVQWSREEETAVLFYVTTHEETNV